MVIDRILDRKEGGDYEAHTFYRDVMRYSEVMPDIIEPIASALDSGTNEEVQNALCNYIIQNGYDPQICDYIKSKIWVAD